MWARSSSDLFAYLHGGGGGGSSASSADSSSSSHRQAPWSSFHPAYVSRNMRSNHGGEHWNHTFISTVFHFFTLCDYCHCMHVVPLLPPPCGMMQHRQTGIGSLIFSSLLEMSLSLCVVSFNIPVGVVINIHFSRFIHIHIDTYIYLYIYLYMLVILGLKAMDEMSVW